MLAEFFLTALITCSSGQASCSSYELEDHVRVDICGILTDESRGRVSPDAVRTFEAVLNGTDHIVTIRPYCEVY